MSAEQDLVAGAVLGGAALAMFAAVAVAGIQTLGKIDLNDHRYTIVVGTSVGLAMMVTAQPFVAGAFSGWLWQRHHAGRAVGDRTQRRVSSPRSRCGDGRPGADLVTLDQVNAMSAADFATTLGAVTEGSPWVIERASAQRPVTDTIALCTALHDALFSGSDGEQSELLNSFANLGTECDVAYTDSTVYPRNFVADANPIASARVTQYEHLDCSPATPRLPS